MERSFDLMIDFSEILAMSVDPVALKGVSIWVDNSTFTLKLIVPKEANVPSSVIPCELSGSVQDSFLKLSSESAFLCMNLISLNYLSILELALYHSACLFVSQGAEAMKNSTQELSNIHFVLRFILSLFSQIICILLKNRSALIIAISYSVFKSTFIF